jgi:hypothetical protein
MANEQTSGLSLALTTRSRNKESWRFSLQESIFWLLAMAVITAVAATRVHADPSLVASWPMNEGSGNVVNDASGNGNDGTLFNGPSWSGGELVFDGANDYADVGNFNVPGSALTITGRFRADSFANCGYQDCRIISKATGTATGDHFMMVSTIKQNNTVRLRFRLKLNGTTKTLVASSGNLTGTGWVSFAAVYNGSRMLLYKDGAQVGSMAATGSISTSNASVWIGGNPPTANSRPWDGSIADINVYNRALSAAEINNTGSSNTPPAFTSSPVTAANVGVAYNYSAAATDPDTGDVVTLRVVKKPGWLSFSGNGDTAELSGTPSSSGSYQVVLEAADLQNAVATQTFNIQVSGSSGGDGLVGSWPLDEGGGNTASDVSGNGIDGTLVNGPSWSGDVLNFDGTNDHVTLGAVDVPGSAMTLAGWVRADDLANCASRDCRIVSKASGTADNDHYFMVSTVKVGSTNTRLRFRLKTNGSTTTLVANSGNLTNNVWVHFAAVYDGANMRLYKDGSLVGSTSKTGTVDTNSNVPVWVGANPPNAAARPWDGSIADVMLYDKALTAQEIVSLMGSVNSPPSFTSSPNTSGTQNQAYTYNIVASDPNAGDVLTISATNLPGWLKFVDNGQGTARLSGTPTGTGSYSVVLEVADQNNAVDTQSFTISVAGGSIGGGVTGGGGTGNNLLVFDWNKPITESDRGFPRNDPPMASANGNWFTPINYAEGTFHVRAQIRSQSVVQDNNLQFCIWQYQFSLETCMTGVTVRGTSGNVVTWSQSIPSMWKLGGKSIDWANPRQRYGMAIKNSSGQPVSNYNGWNWNGENPQQWYPLDMRFTVVVVPKGGSFSGWNNFVN